MIPVGAPAPIVELRDQYGTPVRCAGASGRRRVFVFFPLAFSGVCGSELAELRAGHPLLRSDGPDVFGVTVDSMFSLRAWSDATESSIRLLSDFWPHGATARAFGVFDSATGRAERASFAVDENGTVVASLRVPSDQARTLSMYRELLSAFESASRTR